MKNNLLLVTAFFCIFFSSYAQKDKKDNDKDIELISAETSNEIDGDTYNQWSLEFDLGQSREVSWETARKNPLMTEHNVPSNFKFEASVIWITNDRKSDIGKAIKQWKNAIFSRFNFAECNFSDEQKFMYTDHLVRNVDMLGTTCQDFPGGYPRPIIDEAAEYMGKNYRQLVEVTPRQAVKIADIMHHNADPKLRSTMLQQLWK